MPPRRRRGAGGRTPARHPLARASAARPPTSPSAGSATYPNFLEGFPPVACSDTDNPDSYDAGGRRASPPVRRRLLRAASGHGQPASAPRGTTPTRARYIGPFNRAHRHARPRRRQPLRPRDAATGAPRRPTACSPKLRPAHLARLGPHVAVPVGLRRRVDRPLSPRSPDARARHRLRAGLRAVQRSLRPDGARRCRPRASGGCEPGTPGFGRGGK